MAGSSLPLISPGKPLSLVKARKIDGKLPWSATESCGLLKQGQEWGGLSSCWPWLRAALGHVRRRLNRQGFLSAARVHLRVEMEVSTCCPHFWVVMTCLREPGSGCLVGWPSRFWQNYGRPSPGAGHRAHGLWSRLQAVGMSAPLALWLPWKLGAPRSRKQGWWRRPQRRPGAVQCDWGLRGISGCPSGWPCGRWPQLHPGTPLPGWGSPGASTPVCGSAPSPAGLFHPPASLLSLPRAPSGGFSLISDHTQLTPVSFLSPPWRMHIQRYEYVCIWKKNAKTGLTRMWWFPGQFHEIFLVI